MIVILYVSILNPHILHGKNFVEISKILPDMNLKVNSIENLNDYWNTNIFAIQLFLFSFINRKIEYHFIKNIEKGGIPDILKRINKNIMLRLILLDIIVEFLNILNNERRKIKDITKMVQLFSNLYPAKF